MIREIKAKAYPDQKNQILTDKIAVGIKLVHTLYRIISESPGQTEKYNRFNTLT